MYADGHGVPQDHAEALKWYRLAADQGHANAQNGLGLMYGSGHGVAQDYAEAVKWYRLAAEQGDADAQYGLGLMYTKGRGCRRMTSAHSCGSTCRPRRAIKLLREQETTCRAHDPRADRGSPEAGA